MFYCTFECFPFFFFFGNCAEYSDIVNRPYAKKNKHNTVGHH